MYMLHPLFILVLLNGLGDKILHASKAPILVLGLICYVCIFVASYLSLKFFETPARQRIDAIKVFQ
jgi:peptidoglycan/LPS O-acetylase OafA/YrhL